ncbi:unnamed protein product [Triticum aestivum]|uniref:RNase H type-1 domain-containing protein n=1 Tax=Triticum aestivum TaxID=4565 RepID=A0A7H4LIR6_WHEAT|nr:unnamed protein product [Triticum aestivum]
MFSGGGLAEGREIRLSALVFIADDSAWLQEAPLDVEALPVRGATHFHACVRGVLLRQPSTQYRSAPEVSLLPAMRRHKRSVISDAPLSEILNNRDATGRVAKWTIELLPLDIKFEAKKAIKSQEIADFLVKWIEQQVPTQIQSEHWTMFFDGSKMLNGSGAGIVLVSPRGDKLSYVLQIHFDSSNNEAEYEALLYGLRMAISLGVRRLMVYGDSDLVVNQVMKEWDVRSPAMTGYCNAVRKLEKKFEGLELHHIPRLKNQAADDLAKIGSKREPIPSNVFLEHVHTPSVQEDPFTEEPPQPKSPTDPTEVEIPTVVDLIMEVLVVIPDWTVPYIAYILRKELPEDEEEARQIVR